MGKRVHVYAIVGIALLVVIAVLLVLYFWLRIFYFDGGVNFWLLILCAAVASVAMFLTHRRVLHRERMIRRLYLSRDGIYNYEIGYLPFERIEGGEDTLRLVLFAATSLVEMSYGFEVAGLPDDFKPELMITTDWLRFHRPDGEDEGAVIDQWKGTLQRISSLDEDGAHEVLGAYGNARELAVLLEQHGAGFAGKDAEIDFR